MSTEITMADLVSLAKPGVYLSRIRNLWGLANTWDYGPLGIELKNNIKKLGGKNLSRNALIM